MSLRQVFGRARDRIRRRLGGLRPRVQLQRDAVVLGSSYGGYAVCPAHIDRASVVYSFGVGEDVSFDLALIDRFDVEVHAFDPTPRSLAWVAEQQLPERFLIHPWGLAAYDGSASFAPPADPTHISHTLLPREGRAPVEVEVLRLKTTLERLGHDRVDVLKMDVEGAEYDAIPDVLASDIAIGQLLIEFHHHLEGVLLTQTEACIRQLNEAGYRIFHVSPSGHELSFMRG